MGSAMQSMRDFDPTKPAEIYDEINDCWLDWKPQWALSWQERAVPYDVDGLAMLWDGEVIAGWRPKHQHSDGAAKEQARSANLAFAQIESDLERLRDKADNVGLGRLAHLMDLALVEARTRVRSSFDQG